MDGPFAVNYTDLDNKAAALAKMQDQFRGEVQEHITRLQGYLQTGKPSTPRKRAPRKPATTGK